MESTAQKTPIQSDNTETPQSQQQIKEKGGEITLPTPFAPSNELDQTHTTKISYSSNIPKTTLNTFENSISNSTPNPSTQKSNKPTLSQLQLDKPPKFIELNVGGVIYATSITTLCKYKDSMLAAMFSGRFPNSCDSQGRIFVDRNGKLFHYVLEFLRTEQVPLSPDTESETLKAILREAEFFILEAMAEQLRDMLRRYDLGAAGQLREALFSLWEDFSRDSYTRLWPKILEEIQQAITKNLCGFYQATLEMRLLTKKNFSEFAAPSGSDFDLIQVIEEQRFHIVIPLPYLSHCIVDIWSRFLVEEGFTVTYTRIPLPPPPPQKHGSSSSSSHNNNSNNNNQKKLETRPETWLIQISWLQLPNGFTMPTPRLMTVTGKEK